MNITPDVVAQVSAYVTDKTPSLTQVLANLNAQTIPNPQPQASIKPPMTFTAFASGIDPASLGKVMTYAHLPDIIADIKDQNYDAASLWVSGLTAAGILSTADSASLSKLMSATIPDPSWTPMMSWAQVNLGGILTNQDILDIAKYGGWPKS